MKRTIIACIAGAVVAAGLGFAAPTQAAPCSYFSSDRGWERTFCGVPDLATTVDNAQTNLRNNLSLQQGIGNLQTNLDPGNAAANLQKNLGGLGG